MGIHLQARPGTVTFQADITVGMAGLAGSQIAPRLHCMPRRPLVTGQQPAGMAGLALVGGEGGMGGTDGR